MINWDLDLDNLYNPYDENYFEEASIAKQQGIGTYSLLFLLK